MKRILASFAATVAGLVLLLGFKTHSGAAVATNAVSTTTSDSTNTTIASTSTGTKTITGDSVDTRWGPVQVKLTMSGSTIKSVDVVEYPDNNNRDEEINSYAVPELVSETLKAQSANVQTISGATVTSDGFISSLQSAMSKA